MSLDAIRRDCPHEQIDAVPGVHTPGATGRCARCGAEMYLLLTDARWSHWTIDWEATKRRDRLAAMLPAGHVEGDYDE